MPETVRYGSTSLYIGRVLTDINQLDWVFIGTRNGLTGKPRHYFVRLVEKASKEEQSVWHYKCSSDRLKTRFPELQNAV